MINEMIDNADDTEGDDNDNPLEFGPVVVGSDSPPSEIGEDADKPEVDPGMKNDCCLIFPD